MTPKVIALIFMCVFVLGGFKTLIVLQQNQKDCLPVELSDDRGSGRDKLPGEEV